MLLKIVLAECRRGMSSFPQGLANDPHSFENACENNISTDVF